MSWVLTLKSLAKLNEISQREIESEYELMSLATGATNPADVLSLLEQADEVAQYIKSKQTPDQSAQPKSNLFKKLSQFFSENSPQDLLLLMTGFSRSEAQRWYDTYPALEALKALNIFAEYEVTKKVAEFEAMVYAQGGKIGEEPNSNPRGLDDQPIHKLEAGNPLANIVW